MAKAGQCEATCFLEPSSTSLLGTKEAVASEHHPGLGKGDGCQPCDSRKGESLSTTPGGFELCSLGSLMGGRFGVSGRLFAF